MTDEITRPSPHRRRRTRPRRALAAASAIAIGGLLLSGCASPGDDDVVTLDFFQFKGEALEDFTQIIDDFEAENPDIRIVQNQVADADTIIRTLLVKDKAPDVITLNANGGFGRLAQSGVFYDFSDEPVLQTINPSVQEILADLGNKEGEVNGLGYVNNANGVIYNQEIFEEQGLEVPETWDEFIAVCDALEAAGIVPFYGTLADSWTGLPSFNALGAYPSQGDFFDQMREEGENVGPDSEVSFQKDFQEAMEQQFELFSYTQEGYRGKTYDDGNAAFANGEVAMLMQGIWAINPVKEINPEIDAAIFPYPAADDPDDRLLVSGRRRRRHDGQEHAAPRGGDALHRLPLREGRDRGVRRVPEHGAVGRRAPSSATTPRSSRSSPGSTRGRSPASSITRSRRASRWPRSTSNSSSTATWMPRSPPSTASGARSPLARSP